MIEQLLSRLTKGLVDALPATFVRILLLLTMAGALVLHLSAVGRITALEVQQVKNDAQAKALLDAVLELRDEVRGYRQALIEENRRLRKDGK